MPRIFTAKNGFSVSYLLHFGYDHLDAGISLLKQGNVRYFESSGYLINLGFELILKAWIFHITGEFEGVHDSFKLYERIKTLRKSAKLSQKNEEALAYIAKYETLRYSHCPNAGEIGEDDLLLIQALDRGIWRLLPKALKVTYDMINPTRKGENRILMERPLKI